MPRGTRKIVKKKVIKAWAVLGYNNQEGIYDKPMPFGSLAKNFKGALSIFEKKKDADEMNKLNSWAVVPCEITLKYKMVWKRKCVQSL